MKQFLGKFRGTVVSNEDPENMGRVKVKVPNVLGDHAVFALPCVPYAGKNVGFVMLPEPDSFVWVEFEGGNLDHPIWTGCFWRKGDFPAEIKDPKTKILKFPGMYLRFSSSGEGKGIEMKVDSPVVSDPLIVTLNKDGIEFINKKVKFKMKGDEAKLMTSSQSVELSKKSVKINNGNLEILS